jgi:hypothetical protein
MDLFIFLLFGLFALSVWINLNDMKSKAEKFNDQEKRCPPHKWDYGQDGKIRCKFCGPMSNLGHTARGDE